MLAAHCPEIVEGWPHEYKILNFARSWPRTGSTVDQQPKQVRCLRGSHDGIRIKHDNYTNVHEDVRS